MIEPLRIAFDLDCSPDHAFATWTGRATAWWPRQHTVSHEPGAEIVFEPRAGGRIFERTSGGREIEWGAIVEWDPPRRLRYLWRIATETRSATDVEIVFRELPNSTTHVDIEHGGWDRLGDIGQSWRDTNQAGWDGVLPAYRKDAVRSRPA